MNKHKKYISLENITALFVLIFFISAFIYGFYKKNKINNDGVYLIAKVFKIKDTENGLSYDFNYYYKSLIHKGSIKGFLKLKDSLVLLKISKSKPNLFVIIEDNIPSCILNIDSIKVNWNELPYCPTGAFYDKNQIK